MNFLKHTVLLLLLTCQSHLYASATNEDTDMGSTTTSTTGGASTRFTDGYEFVFPVPLPFVLGVSLTECADENSYSQMSHVQLLNMIQESEGHNIDAIQEFSTRFVKGAISPNFRQTFDCSIVLNYLDLNPNFMSNATMYLISRLYSPSQFPPNYVRTIQEKANNGNVMAQSVLGFLYSTSKGLKKDNKQAEYYYGLAVETDPQTIDDEILKAGIGSAANNLAAVLKEKSLSKEKEEKLLAKSHACGFVASINPRSQDFLKSVAAGQSKALELFGTFLLSEKRYDEALPYLDSAVEQGENCKNLLGNCEQHIAEHLLNKRQYEEAISLLRQSAKHNPSLKILFSLLIFKKGNELISTDDYDNAKICFEAADFFGHKNAKSRLSDLKDISAHATLLKWMEGSKE